MKYKCLFCNQQTNTLHEIFFNGGAGTKKNNRQLCIKYKLQISLCIKCHQQIHKTKLMGLISIFIKLNIAGRILQRTRRIMRISEKQWSEGKRTYIELLGKEIQEKLEKLYKIY